MRFHWCRCDLWAKDEQRDIGTFNTELAFRLRMARVVDHTYESVWQPHITEQCSHTRQREVHGFVKTWLRLVALQGD